MHGISDPHTDCIEWVASLNKRLKQIEAMPLNSRRRKVASLQWAAEASASLDELRMKILVTPPRQ